MTKSRKLRQSEELNYNIRFLELFFQKVNIFEIIKKMTD